MQVEIMRDLALFDGDDEMSLEQAECGCWWFVKTGWRGMHPKHNHVEPLEDCKGRKEPR